MYCLKEIIDTFLYYTYDATINVPGAKLDLASDQKGENKSLILSQAGTHDGRVSAFLPAAAALAFSWLTCDHALILWNNLPSN